MSGARAEFWTVLSIGTLLAIVGVIVARPALALLTGAAAYCGWHVFQFVRFRHRAAAGASPEPPWPAGAWRDIYRHLAELQSDKQRADRNLARFDARFRDAGAVFPDALALFSRTYRVRWCNPVAETVLFDQPLREIRHRRIGEVMPDGELADYLADGDYRNALTLSPTHDRRRVLNIRVTPFGKKKHQLLLIASDITRIHHLDAARRDFVANLSHELRTPLTVIAGYLEMLGDFHKDDEEWSESLVLMSQQAMRMREMIDELTLFSRLETGEKPVREEDIDVAAMIDRIIDEARAVDESGWRQIQTEIDPSLWLRGDPLELHSAFSNLVVNAIRHTPPGTQIRVVWRAQPDSDGALLAVEDDGPGIDPVHLPRITERFYRIDMARSRKSGGTGLGLAIVKHVMGRHDAELDIRSQPGAGSVFECRFGAGRVRRSDADA